MGRATLLSPLCALQPTLWDSARAGAGGVSSGPRASRCASAQRGRGPRSACVAEEDRPTEELAPERRIAARLLEARGLSPPVPVENLVAERMEVQEEFFPADCDAVVYGLTDENR